MTTEEPGELERLARGRKVWRSHADRVQIVLLAAEGLTNLQIGDALELTGQTARKWRNRFAEHRLDGLSDEPRSGRPRHIDDDAVAEVVRKTLEESLEPRSTGVRTRWRGQRSMRRRRSTAPGRDLQALG